MALFLLVYFIRKNITLSAQLYYSNNSLTPWNKFLSEKLTGLQLVKKFPAFYWTRR